MSGIRSSVGLDLWCGLMVEWEARRLTEEERRAGVVLLRAGWEGSLAELVALAREVVAS